MICRSLNDYSQKTYKDSVFSIDDESMPETNTKIVQKTLKSAKKRFGNNYNNEELMYLETEYQDWTTRYPCENKSQVTQGLPYHHHRPKPYASQSSPSLKNSVPSRGR